VGLESIDRPVRMPRGLLHLESQPGGMAGTGKNTTRRETRLERRLMVQLRGHKIEPFPGSWFARQVIPVVITSREINPELALPGNPTCSPATIRAQIAISARGALAQPEEVQRSVATLGQSKI
jgi:hypothetical protein